jgi:hypothetical protein
MNKEKCLQQLREWEIESFNLGNQLSGWYREVFYDPDKDELYRTGELPPNSATVYPDFIYICRIEERNFLDCDFKFNVDDIDEDEMQDILEREYYDANISEPLEDWLEEIENWINRRNEYQDDREWRINKPAYPY